MKIDTTTATDDRGGMWIKAVKVTVVSNQDYEIQTVLSEKAIINTGTVEKPKIMLMMPITYLRHAGGGTQVGTKMVQIVGDGQIVEM